MHLGMPECHKPFLGHCDLDLWPSFKNYCVQSISLILFDVGIPNFGWWFLLGWRSGAYHFESLRHWHWLLASLLGFLCYITANFPQMYLMLDQFLWGHLSRVCDISCWSLEPKGQVTYSKTCVKWPLKNRQNKDFNDKWWLYEGRKYCRMLPLEHSAILLTCIKR